MGKEPVILMTGSADFVRERGLKRIYYYKNYPEALEREGAVVLNVSWCDKGSAERLTALADGLYLTGGDDVEPWRYGEETLPCCGEPEEGRDALELTLIRAFLRAEKPVLGICRGLQVLNVALGGTLWQDIPEQTGLLHPNDSVHWVRSAEGSLLRELFGERFQVNSYHHQAVRTLAPGLVAEAWDETGKLIEGIRHETLPVWAVQWHPERMTGEEGKHSLGPDMEPLFRFFVKKCSEK